MSFYEVCTPQTPQPSSKNTKIKEIMPQAMDLAPKTTISVYGPLTHDVSPKFWCEDGKLPKLVTVFHQLGSFEIPNVCIKIALRTPWKHRQNPNAGYPWTMTLTTLCILSAAAVGSSWQWTGGLRRYFLSPMQFSIFVEAADLLWLV